MKAKLNGILKYAKKLKRFQSGGVTFFEQPTMYKPEEDFYMKTAYDRYSASRKKKKSTTVKDPKVDVKYLTTGPKGTRDHFNNIIDGARSDYRSQVAANSAGWATTSAGIEEADKLKRIVAEATARNSTIDSERKSYVKDLTDNDLTTTAFFGGYFAKNKETNVIDTISAEDYIADPDKYTTYTVDEMLRYADSTPQESSKIYQMLGSISSGNKFIKNNISKEKAVANGTALNSNELHGVYASILDGNISDLGETAGVGNVLSNQLNSILDNQAASNNIYRRVYDNESYVAKIISAKTPEEKRTVRENAVKAEVFKLIYMHGTPKNNSSSDTSGGKDPGGKWRIGDPEALEATGVGLDAGKRLSSTDMSSHLGAGGEEILNTFSASRVPVTKGKIVKINQTALLSDKKNVSASITSVQSFGKLDYIDFDKIHGTGTTLLTGDNGLFKDSQTMKKNMVFTNNDMARISMPTWSDGSPISGMGKFLSEYKVVMEGLSKATNNSYIGKTGREITDANRQKTLMDLKTNGTPETRIVAEYLLTHQGGNVPTSNKLAAETYAYVDEDKLTKDQVYTEVDDEKERENYFKMNPEIEDDSGVFGNGGKVLIKMPIYLDFLPGSDIALKIKSSITTGARDYLIEGSKRTMPLSSLLEQIHPYTPTK